MTRSRCVAIVALLRGVVKVKRLQVVEAMEVVGYLEVEAKVFVCACDGADRRHTPQNAKARKVCRKVFLFILRYDTETL